MKDKIKIEDIPKVTSPYRKSLIEIITSEEEYLADLKKGYPFFNEEELKNIEKKYLNRGMTKEEILSEIHRKGWTVKENTLKHYIQIGQMPRAERREKTEKGLIAYYPANSIRHLNFLKYFLFSKSEFAKLLSKLVTLLKNKDKTILTTISASLESGELTSGDDCLHEMRIGQDRLEEGIAWTEESILKAFNDYPQKRKMYLHHLRKIENSLKKVSQEISEFDDLLEKNTILTPPDMFEGEGSDEKN
jgi:hypothetical protein